MKQLLSCFALVLACFGIVARGAPPLPGNYDAQGILPVPPASPAISSSTNNVRAPAASTAGNYVNDDKHKLMAGDKVSFQIMEDRGVPLPLQVTESSEIDMPYIGRV